MKLIPLTKGQHAIVDDEDFEWLSQWKWHVRYDRYTKSYYAGRMGKIDGIFRTVSMHREILKAKKGQQVDHGNHNTLDNRRGNIAIVTSGENKKNKRLYANNTSGVAGVQWNVRVKRWIALVIVNKKRVHLGSYVEKQDAIDARIKANAEYGFHVNHGKSF